MTGTPVSGAAGGTTVESVSSTSVRRSAQTAARATTQPVVTAPPPASKPAARKAHQPIIGTIKLRQGNGKTETLQVIGNDAPQRGQLRAPQFGVRGKTHG